MMFRLRAATRHDLPGLWEVRCAVAENTLMPGRISDEELIRAIESEGRGIGSALHAEMLAWLAEQPVGDLWRSTGADTRARGFYEARGWIEGSQPFPMEQPEASAREVMAAPASG